MDYAFTDEMVRRDRESLTEQALAYVLNYTGAFQPLLDAKQALAQGFDLNVAEIRMVLNAMRSDTSVRLVYTPPEGGNVIQFPTTRRRGIDFDDPLGRVDRSRRLDDDGEKTVWWRQLKRFKIKMPYAMSEAARSQVIHIISPERSECHYHPIGSWCDGEKVFGQPKWEFRIKMECTSSLVQHQLRFLSEQQAEQLIEWDLMRWCKWCPQLRDARK